VVERDKKGCMRTGITVNSNFWSRTHRLDTIHNVTDRQIDRRQADIEVYNGLHATMRSSHCSISATVRTG